MRIAGRCLAPSLLSLVVLAAPLSLFSGCGASQPSTGTMAGEPPEAGQSTRAQEEFMKKQEGQKNSPGAAPASP